MTVLLLLLGLVLVTALFAVPDEPVRVIAAIGILIELAYALGVLHL